MFIVVSLLIISILCGASGPDCVYRKVIAGCTVVLGVLYILGSVLP